MVKHRTELQGFTDRFIESLNDKGWGKTTLERLAMKFGKSTVSVWGWKNAEKWPAMDTAIFMADVLGVSVEWLLTGRGPKRPGNGSEGGQFLDVSSLTVDQQRLLQAFVTSLHDKPPEKAPIYETCAPTCRYGHGPLEEFQAEKDTNFVLSSVVRPTDPPESMSQGNLVFTLRLYRCPICGYLEIFDAA